MTTLLQQLSDGLAEAVATAGQSIVRVEARRRLAASGIVWSADGLILTAHHVVEAKEGIRIGLPNGEMAAAAVVGRDPTTDLALLRAEARLTPPTWLEPDGLRVGHLVLAVGRPQQQVQSTLGVVSALDGGWRTGAGGKVDSYLQTDLTMYPGFSGGALLSVGGGVIGLNSSALARGVTVSLPVPTLRRVATALAAHGHVRRGYLGVGVQTVRLPAGLAEQLGQETGALITSVEPGSSADEAGLVLGDTLVAFDNQAVRRVDDVQAALSDDRRGAEVVLRIVRGGKVQELAARVGERG
ncbi:MAG: trypsin-like peptidase domain-containing protein [Caldilineales bacterium]|nr:trypsin-like peptidase domain-containing protein [Caldilineales bacterium]